MSTLVYSLAILYGLVIGSFLNVLILRIPVGQDFVKERSHCMKCSYQLAWKDMIPVVSYLVLRGKCRKCGEPISKQYPAIELLNGILYFFVFWFHGVNYTSVVYVFVVSALIVISVIDFRTYEIPFGLTLFIAAMGVCATAIDYKHIPLHIIGMCSVGLFLEILFIVSGGNWIGGGDATLMMAAGLVVGWKNIIIAFLLACVLGAVIHSIRMKVSGEDHVLAFGPYLSMGIVLVMIWGEPISNWYFSMLGL
ncbi:MAG: prepilin peptidase [Lachnospiraceae bacterium]|nr:prepilin peptidase [Lachnospiraceae bacterium]